MDDCIDKIGELLVQYDDLLDEQNITKLCNHFINKNNKIVDLCDIIIKKYSNILNNNLLNHLILNLFIIYENNNYIKQKDKCFNNLEKMIEDYSGTLNDINLKIYMNIIINLYK